MTKLFSSGGTKDIGPQHQRVGFGPGTAGPQGARVSSAKAKPTGFAAFKASTSKPSALKAAPASIAGKRQAAAKTPSKPAAQPKVETQAKDPKKDQTFDKPTDRPVDYTSSLAIQGAGVDQSSLLTGGLMAQFEALGEASGPARANYSWRDSAPQNPAESMAFLSSATQSPANDIFTIDISQQMYEEAQYALSQGSLTGSDKSWAQSMVSQYSFGGPTAYVLNGEILNFADEAELIGEYDKIQQYKAVAQNMIEGERQMKQDFVYGAVAHGQDMALESARGASSAEAARISAQAGVRQSEIAAASQRAIQTMAGEQELAQIGARAEEERATGKALTEAAGVEERLGIGKRGEETRATVKAQGVEDRLGVQERGKEERRTQEEGAAQQMEQLERKLESDENIIRTQGQQALAQIDRQMAGQGSLLDMAQAGDMALQENRQQHQAEENNKKLAIDRGDLDEVIRSNKAQEKLKMFEMQLKQEQNNITNLITIANNPAMLYHMAQSGILDGLVGNSIQGESLGGLIGDLTATINPDEPLPNIQDYNSMSPVMQTIQNWTAGATRGFGEGGMASYLQGASPFTRGQQTQVRPGSSRSPFDAGVI